MDSNLENYLHDLGLSEKNEPSYPRPAALIRILIPSQGPFDEEPLTVRTPLHETPQTEEMRNLLIVL